jgi:hypothetical protein
VRDGERSQELASLTIQQAYDFSHPVAVGQSGISDIEGFLNVYATQFATLNSQFDFNPRNNPGITFANASIALQPPWAAAERAPIYLGKTLQGSFLQVGYSYADRKATVFTATRKNASQFISARAYADVFDRLGLYIAPGYDIASTRLLSTEYGVRLKSPCDCWAADLGIIDSFNPNEVQIQFQVTLGGLGSVGKSPFGRNPFQTGGLVGSPTGVLPTY